MTIRLHLQPKMHNCNIRLVPICCSQLVYLHASLQLNTRCHQFTMCIQIKIKKQQSQLCLTHCKCIYSTQKQVFPGLLGLFSVEDTIRGLNLAWLQHMFAVMESEPVEYLKQFVFSVDSIIHHQTKGLCQHSQVVFCIWCGWN